MSEFLTAFLLSEVKKTFEYPLYSLIFSKFLLVKYNEVIAFLVINPVAIDHPKLPVPMIAIFIIYLF